MFLSGPVEQQISLPLRGRFVAFGLAMTALGFALSATAAELDRVPLVLPAPLPPVYMAPGPATVPSLPVTPDAPVVRRVASPDAEPSVAIRSADELRQIVDTGARHEEGIGVPRNLAKAYALYCEAARLDSPEALMRMGRMYATGRGRPHDDTIANTLLRRAAGAGPDSRDRLPDCLRPPYRIVAYVEPPAPVPSPAPLRNEPASIAMMQPVAEFFAANPGIARSKLTNSVVTMAREFHLDPRLVLAVIRTESNFDPFALSPKNAQGLMQLIPETAERFAVRNAFDPIQNLRGGMSYLRWLLSYFRGDVALTLAAYNAGEGAVDRHRGIPPYPETITYVQRIRALYPIERHPFDANLVPPSSWVPDRYKRVRHEAAARLASD